jgi:CRISPR/Cas system-associated endoribonuclease Cas2
MTEGKVSRHNKQVKYSQKKNNNDEKAVDRVTNHNMRRNQGKSIKESKLAAVQNSAFKGKAGPSQRKPMEHLTEFFKAKNMDTIMTSFLQ